MHKIEEIVNKIHSADCIEFMKEMPEDSIDSIITDPPYGLEFMSKAWDKFNTKKCWDKSGTSTVDLDNAPRFCNLGSEGLHLYYDFSYNWAKEALRVAKPGATLLSFGGVRTHHRLMCAIEDAGWEIKDCMMWLYCSGFPKSTNIGKQMDKKAGAERQILSINPRSRKIEDKSNNIYKTRIGAHNYITEPSILEAKQWNGWLTHGLKPAYEPIIVAMKPNEGSYVENALKWGVAGLNIDGARIQHNEPVKMTNRKADSIYTKFAENVGGTAGYKKPGNVASPNPEGRFPANIILDEKAGKMLDEQSGITSRGHWAKTKVTGFGDFGGGKSEYFGKGRYAGDKGGASRFFYCPKASKSERNKGCEDLEIPEYRWNNGGISQQITGRKGNFHPTVKPIKLMEYLCTLTKTPTGGLVLDPFAGTGTTGIACNNTGRDFILIEKEEEYVDIANRRLKAYAKSKIKKLEAFTDV